ncbi:MAG: tail fiber protein [Bacillota bacterium]
MQTTVVNLQPSLALTEAIAMQGVFPSSDLNTDWLGSIHIFAFNFTAPGLLPANGQALSISSNTAFYYLTGTTWGGDGTTVFNLPDLRGTLTIGNGVNPTTNPYAADHWMGQTLGQERVALSTADLPAYYGGNTSSLASTNPHWTLNDAPSLTIHYLIAEFGGFSSTGGSGIPAMGMIVQYVGHDIPEGTLECDGQLLDISEHETLFALIGTTYGGDGVTTFALPDLRGRAIVGASSSLPLGTYFGSDTMSIGDGNMPAEMGQANTALDNYQPSLALNYIICVQGTFPTPDNINLSDGPCLGEIMAYAGTIPPNGWIFCTGQTLAINQNQALFSLMGTTFGGNGVTTFALPDLRGTTVIGADGDLGQHYGASGITLGLDDIPGVVVNDTDAGATFHGANQADLLNGHGGADTIYGHDGNDQIDGGTGADTMFGGLGNDSFFVDNASDIVAEFGGEGVDTINSIISFTLPANVENLTLLGAAAINATGNADANTLTGNVAANVLSGGDGNDTLLGGSGNDTLKGGFGNDVLNGQAGNDAMAGGAGNDSYGVDTIGDTVTESGGNGTDTVNSTISWTLGANVENLTLFGSGNLDGTGNGLANVITGNSGANHLAGLDGNDTLKGGGGNDTLDGGTGSDVLDGQLGADAMTGGIGNDTYGVDNVLDSIVENPGEGIDTVNSTISWTLGANLETLVLAGTGDIAGTGNELANILTGNSGANQLSGLAGDDQLKGGIGNDTLYGGLGNDVLNGGAGDDWIEGGGARDIVTGAGGADRFVFRDGDYGGATAAWCDTIKDFSQADGDKIDLQFTDANGLAGGDQAFTFIGTDAFGHTAGELRYEQISGKTFVEGDTDGDGNADFMICLTGTVALSSGDFAL